MTLGELVITIRFNSQALQQGLNAAQADLKAFDRQVDDQADIANPFCRQRRGHRQSVFFPRGVDSKINALYNILVS